MIQSKNDLKYYLECDRIALRAKTKKPRFMSDEIWRFQILLRKREYHNKTKIACRWQAIFVFYLRSNSLSSSIFFAARNS